MSLLDLTGNVIAEPFQEIVDSTVSVFPGIVAALVAILVGYLLGSVLGYVVRHVVNKTGVARKLIGKLGLQDEVGAWDLGELFGLITKWYVFVIFLNPAAQAIKLTYLADFLKSVALWIPNIILAVIIALGGYIVAEYVAKKIRTIKAKQKSLLASMAKGLLLVFTALIVLRQVGIAINVAENAFLIVLAGVMLAVALAFGLGMQDEAKGLIKEIKKHL